MSAPEPNELLATLEQTLTAAGIDFASIIAEFGQVKASEDRAQGRHFTLRDHLRGLVLSLLSNQRPWGPIARNLGEIDVIFFGYDPERVQATDPKHFVNALQAIRCGNRAIAKQMSVLSKNIDTLKRIAFEFGSLDAFVAGNDPDAIASKLSELGPYKLRQVGFTLALEYLRNVGIRASKPDIHVRRALSGARLGYFSGHPSEKEASETMANLARANGNNPTYLDNLLWMFCARDYGDICRAKPRCSVCGFVTTCNYPRSHLVGGE